MEYFRDPKNQIYADIAFRLGKIITQYEKMTTDEEKFETTLYLTVLQNLLTNSNEYVRNMTRGERRESIFNQEISDSIWGIDTTCWVKNTFNENPTLQNFIARIRNSVSHPTNIDIESDFPSTGYTTIKNQSGSIDRFRFINSPDTINNRLKKLNEQQVFKTIYQRDSNNQIIHNEFPKDISYRSIPNNEEKFQLILNDEPFIRISIIDLSVKQLGVFVKNLANYLAQPIQKDWDGITIKDLIAA
ncbi:MAG: hypothetical protein LC107_04920 [Chitinophagales bacterium]|nr:hypothetical protein [Chitinophagales bacterium]